MLVLEEVVTEQYPKLLRLAKIMIGKNDAEDLVQDTMLAAVTAWPRYHGGSRPSTWLIAILRRQYFTTLRRMRIRRTVRLPENVEIVAPETAHHVAHVALDRLSREHRQTLVKFYFDGLSYSEIASTMNVPVGTVRSRLFEAKDRLRQFAEAA